MTKPPKKQRWLEQQQARLDAEDAKRKKQVSMEEVEETVSRLYDADVASRDEKFQTTVAKYIKEPSDEEKEKSQRSPEDIAAAVTRLTTESIAKQQTSLAKLNETYAPALESKKLTKEEQEAAVARLHDESERKTRELTQGLASRYLSPSRSRFCGATKLNNEGWAAMGNRLCTPKSQ